MIGAFATEISSLKISSLKARAKKLRLNLLISVWQNTTARVHATRI
jgi:hypothetical protein